MAHLFSFDKTVYRKQPFSNLIHSMQASFSAFAVLRSFARTLKIDTRYKTHFGNKNEEAVDHMIRSTYQNRSYPFNLSFSLRNVLSHVHYVVTELAYYLPYRFQRWIFGKAYVAGYDALIITRKIMIERKIVDVIKNRAIKQIVIFGSGLDPRGLLIAQKYPDVNVFLIDKGLTKDLYAKAVSSLDLSNHHLIDCDLDTEIDSLKTELIRYGFDQSVDVCFVAEGLTVYLEKKTNKKLLNFVSDLMHANSEFIVSYLPGVPKNIILKASHKAANEVHRFTMPLENLIDYVHKANLEVTEKFTIDSIAGLEKNNVDIKKYHEDKRTLEPYYRLVKHEAASMHPTSLEAVPEMQIALKCKKML